MTINQKVTKSFADNCYIRNALMFKCYFFFLSFKFTSFINLHCVAIRLRSQLTLKEVCNCDLNFILPEWSKDKLYLVELCGHRFM